MELGKIAIGKSDLDKDLLKNIPYKEILKTASVWAIWIAAIGNFVCVNMMFLYSPVSHYYYKKFQIFLDVFECCVTLSGETYRLLRFLGATRSICNKAVGGIQ